MVKGFGWIEQSWPGAGTISVVYVTDPEGNMIELQHWAD
jgi:hypothetical protein